MLSITAARSASQTFTDWRRWLGIGLGVGLFLLAFAGVRHWLPSSRVDAYPKQGPLTADCEGTLRTLVVQYPAAAGSFSDRPLRGFLGEMPADVEVMVVCPAAVDFETFQTAIGKTACRLSPVFTGHPITGWSRDRWLSLAPGRRDGPVMLLRMREEYGAEGWPARQGDERVAAALAAARPDQIIARRSLLCFDGGDFVADDRTVFVTPRVLEANPGWSRADMQAHLESVFDRSVVMLDQAPPHHAGMYMMPVGENRVLVGDPSLALRVAEQHGLVLPLSAPDRSTATQNRFDAVAESCRQVGFEVTRIPVMPNQDGRTYLSYVNGIIDVRREQRIIYLPVFDGVAPLNRAAEKVWQQLGYNVHRINCTDSYQHYGTLRCLVNVLARD